MDWPISVIDDAGKILTLNDGNWTWIAFPSIDIAITELFSLG